MQNRYLFFLIVLSININAQDYHKTDSLQKLISTTKPDTSTVLTYIELSELYYYSEKYDSTLIYINQGLALAKKLKFTEGIIKNLINKGEVFVRKQNNTKALETILEALKIAEENEMSSEIILTLHSLSTAYASFNNYPQALIYQYKEKVAYEALIKNDIYRSNYQKNLRSDSIKYCMTIARLAFFNLKLNKLDSALKYSQLSYDYLNLISKKDPSYMAYILNCLGGVQRKLGNYTNAFKYFRKSIDHSLMSKNHNSLFNLSKSYWELAIIFKEMNQIDSSNYYAKKALTLSQQIHWAKDILEIEIFLANNYNGIDNKQAVYFYSAAANLRDSLYNQEKVTELQNLTYNEQERQKELEFEKKRIELERQINIQYSLIAIGIIIFFILFLLLSRSIIANPKIIAFLGVVALMIVFEFINLLIGPYVSRITNNSPVLSLLAAICIAGLLAPIHSVVEKFISNKIIEKNKAIRLEARLNKNN